MKNCFLALIFFLLTALISIGHAKTHETKRIEQFSNNKVKVWKTIIYPHSINALKMHRHDHDRVLIALSSGVLKIVTNQGNTHYLKLKKGKAYFLKKDEPNVLHSDENVGEHSIAVMVVNLN